jgi:hypothetical protein
MKLGSEDGEILPPQWLAHRFDEARNEVRFVDYGRATRAGAPFLTDDYLPSAPYRAEPRSRALQLAPAVAPIHFVFHSGFCCSTLFASCFDQPGLATTFSEPMILNDVVGWRKRGASPADVGWLLEDALNLLARPFPGDRAAVVKPSTVVNGLAAAMMSLQPEACAIILYAPLEDFLTSIAKKGIDGRLWARELFLAMRREALVEGLGFGDAEFFGQTDLQIAAVAWLGQQRLFEQLARRFPERVRSLDSKRFLDQPRSSLEAGGEFLGIPLSPAELDAAGRDRLSRNSKDGKPYSKGARQAEYRAASAAYGDEINKVATWARAVASAASVPLEPGHPVA